jgi:D-tyrosyl-tRNA(Tyr) deacylase
MRAVVQRVKNSSVIVGETTVGAIGPGLMVLLGVAGKDTEKDADYLAEKIPHLRIFEDENQKMNLSLLDAKGSMLVVSQFTLMGNCRKGRRPSFVDAAAPDKAMELYEYFVKKVKEKGVQVETGQFRAKMEVTIVNDGPVTLIIDS